jgi:glycosyltransferase involved in cell wall biosynthesis
VSSATADLVTLRWGLPRGRITLVRPGVDPCPPAGGAAEAGGRPYFLFVGALEPRKAPEVLARGFAQARAEGLEAELVVVGDGRLRDVLDGAEGIRMAGGRRREELEALYAGALAVVMPSWLEGYGLPPLEAAACGTPSIVSDLPAFRETLGAEGALFVAPGDARALGAALLRMAQDPGLRERLATAARARVEGMTWERAAEAMHPVLVRAAGG